MPPQKKYKPWKNQKISFMPICTKILALEINKATAKNLLYRLSQFKHK